MIENNPEKLIGQKVTKKSNKPFKSTLKANTVAGIVEHEHLSGVKAFTFKEDDSQVAIYKCQLEETA